MRADLLFEDYLVAKARFLAARRRARAAAAAAGVPLRDQQKHAAPSRSLDVKIHGNALRRVLLLIQGPECPRELVFDERRGLAPKDPSDPKWALARRVAAMRLRCEAEHKGCQCGDPACPARPRLMAVQP